MRLVHRHYRFDLQIEFGQLVVMGLWPLASQNDSPYGWMASNSRTTRDRLKWLVWLFLGWTYWLGSGVAPQPDRFESKRLPCNHCGGTLHLIAITDSSARVQVSRPLPQSAFTNHATNYLDSG